METSQLKSKETLTVQVLDRLGTVLFSGSLLPGSDSSTTMTGCHLIITHDGKNLLWNPQMRTWSFLGQDTQTDSSSPNSQ